jgi:AcrR family transcriptional regulator
MIESAAVLFRERGVHGTSFADVLEHSGAPRGSVYHHFKGGKTQIAEEALRWAGESMLAGIVEAMAGDDPVAAVDTWCEGWSALLRESDYAAGCSIVAAVQDGGHEPTVRAVAGEVFASWEHAVAEGLRARGLDPAESEALATLLIAAVEGAVVIARSQRSLEPLRRVSSQLQQVVGAALSRPTPRD